MIEKKHRRILKYQALRDAGCKSGDTVIIMDLELEFLE